MELIQTKTSLGDNIIINIEKVRYAIQATMTKNNKKMSIIVFDGDEENDIMIDIPIEKLSMLLNINTGC